MASIKSKCKNITLLMNLNLNATYECFKIKIFYIIIYK